MREREVVIKEDNPLIWCKIYSIIPVDVPVSCCLVNICGNGVASSNGV